jgi:hypothetical protein
MVTSKKAATKKPAAKKAIKAKGKVASKIKPAHIMIVLDRSGSMSSIKSDTIGGYNNFVAEQKKLKAKTRFTLVQFDNLYEIVYDGIDINDVPMLTDTTFVPRGGTALYDAIGKTVSRHLAEEQSDELKILAVLTDGEENASREHSHAMVTSLLKNVQDNHGWEVLFLGSNIDAKVVGVAMGIGGHNTVNFAGVVGASNAYAAASTVAVASRGFMNSKMANDFEEAGAMLSNGKINTQALYNATLAGKVTAGIGDDMSNKINVNLNVSIPKATKAATPDTKA